MLIRVEVRTRPGAIGEEDMCHTQYGIQIFLRMDSVPIPTTPLDFIFCFQCWKLKEPGIGFRGRIIFQSEFEILLPSRCRCWKLSCNQDNFIYFRDSSKSAPRGILSPRSGIWRLKSHPRSLCPVHENRYNLEEYQKRVTFLSEDPSRWAVGFHNIYTK